MPELSTSVRVVLSTATDAREATRIGRALVEEQLAACVTVIPSVESIYRWKGEIVSSAETLLLLKTSSEKVAALQSRLIALHSYETPEFLVLEVEAGSPSYLDWIQASLRPAESTDPDA